MKDFHEIRISVIIAVFNGAETLQACLDSVIAQTFRNIELIVIDGGSTDESVAILRSNDAKIAYWESEPDRGIYHAWNKALTHVTGDYVCFLGADDRFSEESSVLNLMALLPDSGEYPDLICSKFALVNSRDEILKIKGAPWDWERMKKWMCVAHPGMFHHVSLFRKYGSFNETYKICSDYEFCLRLGGEMFALYVDYVSVLMGACGISNARVPLVLRETKMIQQNFSEIGLYRALLNYSGAYFKFLIRKLLCKV